MPASLFALAEWCGSCAAALGARVTGSWVLLALTTLVVALWLRSAVLRLFFAHRPSPHKYILITGCDSGFGQQVAVELDREGWSVIAACLTSVGCERLQQQCSARLCTLQLDVTSDDSVAEMRQSVQRITNGRLFCLLNNAGVTAGYFHELSHLSDYRLCMEVNYFGVVRVTNALLPLLRNTRHSRIVIVASIAGQIAIAGMGPYAATKFAVEGYGESLRREIAPFGVAVSLVEPSFSRTFLLSKILADGKAKFEGASPELQKAYGPLRRYCDAGMSVMAGFMSASVPQVTAVIRQAVLAAEPSHRYHVSFDSKWLMIPLHRHLPSHWNDAWIAATNRLLLLVDLVLGRAQQ